MFCDKSHLIGRKKIVKKNKKSSKKCLTFVLVCVILSKLSLERVAGNKKIEKFLKKCLTIQTIDAIMKFRSKVADKQNLEK